mgnify:CR=1 FL=1
MRAAGKTAKIRAMKIGVYGTGRFGVLWARLLARAFPVVAHNRTPRPFPDPSIPMVSLEELAASDVVFICTAISSIEPVLEGLAPHLAPGTLVADTCSVKIYPVRCMERILPPEVRILGTHPMFGPDSARDGFDGLPLILCPVRISGDDTRFWRELFSGFGLRVFTMTPDEHDREAAFTQGIAHFVGRVLKDLDLRPSAIATMGYRKLLEIMEQTCNDPWRLFLDLQNYNPHTLEMRDLLQRSFRRILAKLDSPPGDH